MNASAAVTLLLLIGAIGANLPFLSDRLLLVGPRRRRKPAAWRIVELVLIWAATLGVGFFFEARLGQVRAQGWEFYVALAFAFVTFAFPGFVWRYLKRAGTAAR